MIRISPANRIAILLTLFALPVGTLWGTAQDYLFKDPVNKIIFEFCCGIVAFLIFLVLLGDVIEFERNKVESERIKRVLTLVGMLISATIFIILFGIHFWPVASIDAQAQKTPDILFGDLIKFDKRPQLPGLFKKDDKIGADSMLFSGWNFGGTEVKIQDMYIISRLTGEKRELFFFSSDQQPMLSVEEVNPVPPGAQVYIRSKPGDPKDAVKFLDDFENLDLVLRYQDSDHRITITKADIDNSPQMLNVRPPPPVPRVTKKDIK